MLSTKVIYLLSGLGADKRVFEFLDLSAFTVSHIDWTNPGENESLEAYARRLCAQIKTNKPTLIGVSFGGMVAIEIAKHIPCEKVILISSAATKSEIPFYFRVAGKMRLHKLVPIQILKQVNSFTQWIFGMERAEEQALLKEIIQQTDIRFLRWAIDKIVSWRNLNTPPHVVKIHGTMDRILPATKADYQIEGGGRFMIGSKAAGLSVILHKQLALPTNQT
ncbi:MAG: alpha/beta hydrolase [Cyclobacteriaceae bacterium]|nr:alpha/beta hydrolase [Cyclobacteriaceae bacterium]